MRELLNEDRKRDRKYLINIWESYGMKTERKIASIVLYCKFIRPSTFNIIIN
jgi:hypothetical protein